MASRTRGGHRRSTSNLSRRPHQFEQTQPTQITESTQTTQTNEKSRYIWTHIEVKHLVEAMREMVQTGVYKDDNGFKPGYLNFIEEKMLVSCPNLGIKAIPHIESHVKTLKKDWTIVHDILTGTRHGTSGFGYDSTNHMVVASDDVWDDNVKHFPAASKWRNKMFRWYEECCFIFRNDRATGDEARDPTQLLDEANEAEANEVASSESASSKEEEVRPEQSSGTKRSRSDCPEVSTN